MDKQPSESTGTWFYLTNGAVTLIGHTQWGAETLINTFTEREHIECTKVYECISQVGMGRNPNNPTQVTIEKQTVVSPLGTMVKKAKALVDPVGFTLVLFADMCDADRLHYEDHVASACKMAEAWATQRAAASGIVVPTPELKSRLAL